MRMENTIDTVEVVALSVGYSSAQLGLYEQASRVRSHDRVAAAH